MSDLRWESSDWLPIGANFNSCCFTSNLTLLQPSALQFVSPSLRLGSTISSFLWRIIGSWIWCKPVQPAHHIVLDAFAINTICALHFSRLLFHPPPCTLHPPPHRPAAHLLLCPRKPLCLLLLSALSFLACINRDHSATRAGIPEVTDTHTHTLSGCKQPWLWQTRL